MMRLRTKFKYVLKRDIIHENYDEMKRWKTATMSKIYLSIQAGQEFLLFQALQMFKFQAMFILICSLDTTLICWNHIVTLSCPHGNHISVLSSTSSEASSSCNNSITHRNETFLITDEIKLVCENHQNCTLNPVKLLTWKQTGQHIEVHHACLPDEKYESIVVFSLFKLVGPLEHTS